MQERITTISTLLDKHKAENIETFHLAGKEYFVDSVIIATSIGGRHSEALLEHLKRELKGSEEFLSVDESPDWVAIDLGDILIHIMTSEYRSKYDLESFLSELSENRTS